MNEGAQNISQDGKWLIFTGCNFPDGAGSCDLYFSYLGKDGWSEPQNLGYPINTAAWESAPSLSPDKRDLYFTSNRLGGFGGSDLYVSHLQPNGHWSNPENLGPAINTAGDEGSPFIHADNHSLYFTSNGHLGYGGDDLYLSRKDSTGKWGNAINLGYPINSIENEGSLIVAADGQTAYYASDRSDSRGGLDIYSFQLRKDIRPTRTLWVKGRVYDKKTGEGLPSAVELTDIETGEIMNLLRTDKEGNYLVTLPVGRNYAFNVNRKGYLFYSDHFALSSSQPDSTYQKDIPLQPIEANASIVLKNIFFETGEYQLKPESATELDQVVRLLMDNPSLKIEISGHTDNIGQDKDNLSLSLNRARSVVNYFIEKGIAANRLTYKGYGAQKPIAGNDTEEGRSQNRRTELKIINP
jgi:outer membrane protein OmpA-like peptidoglycan-associated protein